MLPVIHHRIGKSLAVILAFAAWLGAAYLFREADIWRRIAWYGSGVLIFFLLGVMLPEYRKLRFLSRQSALRLMTFLMLLVASELIMHFRDTFEKPAAIAAAYVCPFLCYFASVYLIRGLRTPPQYPAEDEAKPEPKSGEAEKTPAPVPAEPMSEVSDETRVASLMGKLEESTAGESK